MINAVRTWLLNPATGSSYPVSFPGEEYVPPSYQQRTLPSPGMSIRRVLFGADPDRAYLNWRVNQLTAILHATPTPYSYVVKPDPRITYRCDELYTSQTGVTVEIESGTEPLYILGDLTPDDVNGKLHQAWRVQSVASGTVRVSRLYAPATTVEHSVSYTDNLSGIIPLHGSDMDVRVPDSAALLSWLVTGTAIPVRNLVTVVTQLDQVINPEVHGAWLFGDKPTADYAVFKDWWFSPTSTLYDRLAGLALALAYRTGGMP